MAFDKLAWQREYRKKNGNSVTSKYERTKSGKLMRMYRNMLSRVSGVQSKKRHLYEGKEIIDKELFYKFAMESEKFHELYDGWVASGYQMKMSPSVDRIDSSLGYVIGNMEFVTHSENSRRASAARKVLATD